MTRVDPFERLVRIETRLAAIQEHFGLPTKLDHRSQVFVDFASEQSTNQRLARIETRLYKLMQSLNLNPKTGEKYETQNNRD